PVGTPEARREALARFGALPAYGAAQEVNLREGLSTGYSDPQAVGPRVIEQLRVLRAQPVEQSTFASPGLRDGDPAFRARWLALVRDEIQPPLARYLAFLEEEYLPRARSEIGVTAQLGGPTCYRATLRVATTLGLSPEEVQGRGRAPLATTEGARRALRERSSGGARVEQLLARFRDDPAYRYADAEQVLAVARAALARADAALPRVFGLLPS